MAGVLDYQRYIDLFYTAKNVQDHFPEQQLTVTYEFDDNGYDGWTGEIFWQTLVIDQLERDVNNNPVFTNSQVLGGFPADSMPAIANGILQFPENMYSGPIIPDRQINVPITVVNFRFTKDEQIFSQQFVLIENWMPGHPIGSPLDDENFQPLITKTSNLTLDTDVYLDTVLIDDTIELKVTTDIPIPLAPGAYAKFYYNNTGTSYTFIGTGTFVDSVAALTIQTADFGLGTKNFKATFTGRKEYGFVTSNILPISIVDGYPLDVTLINRPDPTTPGTTQLSTATGRIATGFPSTATEYITNPLTFTVQSNGTTRYTESGNFVNGYYEADYPVEQSWIPANINDNTSYTVYEFSGTPLTARTGITETFTATLAWSALRPQLITGGSRSENFSMVTTTNYAVVETPLTLNVRDHSNLQTATNIWSVNSVDISARVQVASTITVSANQVEFYAQYDPNVPIMEFVLPQGPEITSISTNSVYMPLLVGPNQALLTRYNDEMRGLSFQFPYNYNANQRYDTGTYVISTATLITTGVETGNYLVTLDRNWQVSPFSDKFWGTMTASVSYDVFKYVPGWTHIEITRVNADPKLNDGWVYMSSNHWSSAWVNTVTNTTTPLRRGANPNGLANYTYNPNVPPYVSSTTGYWINYIRSGGYGGLDYSDRGGTSSTERTRTTTWYPDREMRWKRTYVASEHKWPNGEFPYPNGALTEKRVDTTFEEYYHSAFYKNTTYGLSSTFEKNKIYFNKIVDNIEVGSRFSLQGLSTATTTNRSYTVVGIDAAAKSITVDPPWYNHNPDAWPIVGGSQGLNNKIISFTNFAKTTTTNILSQGTVARTITELKYIGVNTPHLSAYEFNKLKLNNNSGIYPGSTFRLAGNSSSPISTTFTMVEQDTQGYWTFTPAYSITPPSTAVQQWQRDDEVYNYFVAQEMSRPVGFSFSQPATQNSFITAVTNDNTSTYVIVDYIPTGFRTNGYIFTPLTGPNTKYTVTEIDPFRRTLKVARDFNLNRKLGAQIGFVNPTSTTATTIFLGTSTQVTGTAGNYRWALNDQTLPMGDYQITATIANIYTTGTGVTINYPKNPVQRFGVKSADAIQPLLDIFIDESDPDHDIIVLSSQAATSIDPNHYYVFPTNADLYNESGLLATSPWTRLFDTVVQTATFTLEKGQLNDNSLNVYWPGSENYTRIYNDQILFRAARLYLYGNPLFGSGIIITDETPRELGLNRIEFDPVTNIVSSIISTDNLRNGNVTYSYSLGTYASTSSATSVITPTNFVPSARKHKIGTVPVNAAGYSAIDFLGRDLFYIGGIKDVSNITINADYDGGDYNVSASNRKVYMAMPDLYQGAAFETSGWDNSGIWRDLVYDDPNSHFQNNRWYAAKQIYSQRVANTIGGGGSDLNKTFYGWNNIFVLGYNQDAGGEVTWGNFEFEVDIWAPWWPLDGLAPMPYWNIYFQTISPGPGTNGQEWVSRATPAGWRGLNVNQASTNTNGNVQYYRIDKNRFKIKITGQPYGFNPGGANRTRLYGFLNIFFTDGVTPLEQKYVDLFRAQKNPSYFIWNVIQSNWNIPPF